MFLFVIIVIVRIGVITITITISVITPPNNGNAMIVSRGRVVFWHVGPNDAATIIHERRSVDRSLDGTAHPNFRLQLVNLMGSDVAIRAIFGNRGIGIAVHGFAFGNEVRFIPVQLGPTSATRIHRTARRVHVTTKAFLFGIVTTSQVWLTRVKRHMSRDIGNKVIRASGRAAMTATGHVGAAIEQELNGQVNFVHCYRIVLLLHDACTRGGRGRGGGAAAAAV